MAEYRFKAGSRLPRNKAAVVGRHLKRLESRQGAITADVVLDDAQSGRSPLHEFFQWDDTEAARQFRLEQARWLIRSVEVVLTGAAEGKKTRAYVHFRSHGDEDEADAPYMATVKVLKDPALRARLLRQALRELETVRVRYGELEELTDIFTAIDKARRKKAS